MGATTRGGGLKGKPRDHGWIGRPSATDCRHWSPATSTVGGTSGEGLPESRRGIWQPIAILLTKQRIGKNISREVYHSVEKCRVDCTSHPSSSRKGPKEPSAATRSYLIAYCVRAASCVLDGRSEAPCRTGLVFTPARPCTWGALPSRSMAWRRRSLHGSPDRLSPPYIETSQRKVRSRACLRSLSWQ